MNKKRYVYIIFLNIILLAIWNNTYKISYQEKIIIPNNAREVCSNNDYIYYIVDENDCIDIVKLDTSKKNREVIYKHKAESNVNILELQAIDDYLIWVENPTDYNWKIVKYNLIKNEKSIVRTFEQSNNSFVPACLNANDAFLSWYESSYNNENVLDETLVIYNIKTNEIIKKNSYLYGNPYLRAYIRDDYVSYITKEDNSYYINIYNLITKDVEKINCISKVAKVISNGEFTVWMDDYDYRNIHVYDSKDKSYNKIEGSLNLFTFMLIHNNLYISYLEDDDGFANIYSFDLITNTKTNITKNNNKNTSYYLSKLNADNRLLYEKVDNEKRVIILED